MPDEIRSKIKKEIGDLPEKDLNKLVDFLKEINDDSSGSIDTSFEKVIAENRGLLKRLAD